MAVKTPDVRNPGSVFDSSAKLRARSPAPVRRTTETAISAGVMLFVNVPIMWLFGAQAGLKLHFLDGLLYVLLGGRYINYENVKGYPLVWDDGAVVNQANDPDPLGGGYIGLRNMQGVDRVSYDDFEVFEVR